MNDVLIDEICKLFSEAEDGIYVGSRDQMRLAIQLKTNSFIPIGYLDKVFRAFMSSGLILKLDKGKPIERQIGNRYYKLQTQRAYCINNNIGIEDRKKIIDSISIVISDLKKKYTGLDLELVKDSDIQKLRELEINKGIELKDLLGWNSYPSMFKFSDEEFLYDVSRSTILDYINRLEEYSPKKIQEEKEESKKQKTEKENLYNRVYIDCIKVIEKALKVELGVEMQLYKSKGWYEHTSNKIGAFKVLNIISQDNILLVTDNNNYKITVVKTKFDISINDSTISIFDDNLEYKFLITNKLYAEMLVLIQNYRKLLRGEEIYI